MTESDVFKIFIILLPVTMLFIFDSFSTIKEKVKRLQDESAKQKEKISDLEFDMYKIKLDIKIGS